jgi:macrodomain Ter protein organizer (MatP/YcbG family)
LSSRPNDSATGQNDAHRLAVIEIDNSGSVGSALTLFEQAAATVAQRPAPPKAPTAEDMRVEAEAIRRQIAEATELADAAAMLRDAELEAVALRRRLQRTISAEKHRLDRERRRAEGGLYAGQSRADNRPTRVAVDVDAWEVLKGDAIRRRSSVGYLVAQLIADAVRHNKLPRIPADDHSVTPRFARLVRLDVENWTAFRSMALDARVTTTRMVGVLVEYEAHRLGGRR